MSTPADTISEICRFPAEIASIFILAPGDNGWCGMHALIACVTPWRSDRRSLTLDARNAHPHWAAFGWTASVDRGVTRLPRPSRTFPAAHAARTLETRGPPAKLLTSSHSKS